MTSFYIEGKWVELDELVKKAGYWDEYAHTLIYNINKLQSIEHHFRRHDRMYVFDFNVLMDEASSEFMKKCEK